MNLSPGLVELLEVGRGEHPGVGDHHQGLDAVPGLERADDREQGEGLGLVALEAADLEGEPAPVDQEADHDLRVHPAFLGVADLAQVVLTLGLEVQRGHVIEDQGQVPMVRGVGEASSREPVPVPAPVGPGQGAPHRPLTRRGHSQLTEDPAGVQQRGRLHHPREHQVPEHLVPDRVVEAQAVVHPGQGLVQQVRGGRDHPRRRHRPTSPGRRRR